MKKKSGKNSQYPIEKYLTGNKYRGITSRHPLVLSNLLFLAVLASLICYILWNVVLKQLGTMRASNYIYLNPLVTMVASVLILHEQITWITLMGAACIILGVYLAEKK